MKVLRWVYKQLKNEHFVLVLILCNLGYTGNIKQKIPHLYVDWLIRFDINYEKVDIWVWSVVYCTTFWFHNIWKGFFKFPSLHNFQHGCCFIWTFQPDLLLKCWRRKVVKLPKNCLNTAKKTAMILLTKKETTIRITHLSNKIFRNVRHLIIFLN